MIKTTVDTNGFEGTLFLVDNRKDKVVIVVSGSNGGMRMTKDCAEFYYKNGIPALAAAKIKIGGIMYMVVAVDHGFVDCKCLRGKKRCFRFPDFLKFKTRKVLMFGFAAVHIHNFR